MGTWGQQTTLTEIFSFLFLRWNYEQREIKLNGYFCAFVGQQFTFDVCVCVYARVRYLNDKLPDQLK